MAIKLGLLLTEDSALFSDLFEIWSSPINACIQGEVSWTVFRVCDGHLPLEHEVEAFTGFVITGSHYSVRDIGTTPWMQQLAALVRSIAGKHAVHLVGGCFGHQLVAEALGGKVGFNINNSYVLGREEIVLEDAASKYLTKYLPAGNTPLLHMLESHEDCVVELPAGSVLLGHSIHTKHEMLAIGSNIFTFQFHPEFTKLHILDRILPRTDERGAMGKEELDAIKADVTAASLSSSCIISAVSDFLVNGWH